ncbi:MAG: pantetheine-phosphate adenylyltransferase [Kiritimatiellia bacterium]|jgi:pantetheine-phosphate adenylyltransferase
MLKPNSIVYPGTFDPLTLGHLDLLERARGLFDHVIVAISANTTKAGWMFSAAERLEMVNEVIEGMDNVSAMVMDGLLVDFVRRCGARVVLRGLRAYSDFEYEFQMALTNRKLAPEIETIFMMPKENHSYVSSSTVREVSRYAGDTSIFVPPAVQRHLERRVVIDCLNTKTP